LRFQGWRGGAGRGGGATTTRRSRCCQYRRRAKVQQGILQRTLGARRSRYAGGRDGRMKGRRRLRCPAQGTHRRTPICERGQNDGDRQSRAYLCPVRGTIKCTTCSPWLARPSSLAVATKEVTVEPGKCLVSSRVQHKESTYLPLRLKPCECAGLGPGGQRGRGLRLGAMG